MAKIVFFCIPAFGHTNPTLQVVKELISQGHQVIYYSYNLLKEKIENTGAKFISCDDYDMEQKLSKEDTSRLGSDLAFSTKILVDTTLALDEKVCTEMKQIQPDCIVADSMAIWGKFIALKLGIPFVSSTTTFAFNQHSAKIMKQSFGQVVKMIISMGKIQKEIIRLQNKGYPVNNVLDIIQNDENTNTIVYTSQEFQPESKTFSDKYEFVGPSIIPAKSEITKNRKYLIYVSMGTVINKQEKFFMNFIKAFQNKEDFQVIISTGKAINIEDFIQNYEKKSKSQFPQNIQMEQTVDQIAVLSKTDVFVSHCGMNSVNESLFYKVPLVMIPQTTEQKGVANCVNQVGAGIFLKNENPKTIFDTVTQVLNNSTYSQNAKIISDSFKNCSGPQGAAKKILSCIR